MNNCNLWIRVDNRLVHGQVIETWLPYAKVNVLIVANDNLAKDKLQQGIISLAVPGNVQLIFSEVANVHSVIDSMQKKVNNKEVFILFANCRDAKLAFEQGLNFCSLNIGNIHYGPGKQQICDHIALSKEDINCLSFFKEKGVKFDFRCIPNTQMQVKPIW